MIKTTATIGIITIATLNGAFAADLGVWNRYDVNATILAGSTNAIIPPHTQLKLKVPDTGQIVIQHSSVTSLGTCRANLINKRWVSSGSCNGIYVFMKLGQINGGPILDFGNKN